jgi:hypothetical protein
MQKFYGNDDAVLLSFGSKDDSFQSGQRTSDDANPFTSREVRVRFDLALRNSVPQRSDFLVRQGCRTAAKTHEGNHAGMLQCPESFPRTKPHKDVSGEQRALHFCAPSIPPFDFSMKWKISLQLLGLQVPINCLLMSGLRVSCIPALSIVSESSSLMSAI